MNREENRLYEETQIEYGPDGELPPMQRKGLPRDPVGLSKPRPTRATERTPRREVGNQISANRLQRLRREWDRKDKEAETTDES